MVVDFQKIVKENKNLKKKDTKEKSTEWKPISKSIIKKEPQATYVIESNPYRNSSFNKLWSKESMLKWS